MKKLILTSLLVFFNVNAAQAACDTKSLKATYTVVGTGTSNGKNCGVIGVAIFDGKGKMEMHTLEGCGSEPQTEDSTFTYKIDNTCMGSFTSWENRFTSYFIFNKALSSGTILTSGNTVVMLGTLNKQ